MEDNLQEKKYRMQQTTFEELNKLFKKAAIQNILTTWIKYEIDCFGWLDYTQANRN
jgi:hypothetical protein